MEKQISRQRIFLSLYFWVNQIQFKECFGDDTICICHEDGIRHPDYPCNDYDIGDGYCHGINNNEICDFDGGKITFLHTN